MIPGLILVLAVRAFGRRRAPGCTCCRTHRDGVRADVRGAVPR